MKLKYPALLRVLLALAGFALASSLRAQMPSMKTDDKDPGSVYLQKLAVDVKIAGALATTTWTMTFKNKTGRILEGELNFPLPAGISVSRYALDINGRLREAVPVEKAKGTLLFENIERRRVDPGLLEKVDGNTFRTRIYPINPGGVRTVLIAYEEDLSGEAHDALRYNLPMAFRNPIEEFGLDIGIIHSITRPIFESNTDNALQFNDWKDTWSASCHWQNYRADQSIAIRIPKTPGAGEVMMQQTGNHYFYTASVFLHPGRIERSLPHHITLLWDASLSGLSRNHKKEMDLLNAYFTRLNNAAVTLVDFSNTVQEPKQFSVTNGQWQSLKTALEKTVYDGATQFGALDLNGYPGDEFLLFSDGHSNFGASDIRLGESAPAPAIPVPRPVYAVVSTAAADFPFLQSIALRSGGELINLENTGMQQAREQLLYQNLQFLGVKPSSGLDGNYPSLPTTVQGGITVAGISYQPAQQIVLQFGYGGKVTFEQKIALDYSRQHIGTSDPNSIPDASPIPDPPAIFDPSDPAGVFKRSHAPDGALNLGHSPDLTPDLSRIWAQKKIAEMDLRYDDNRTEIEQLGRRYGIVTRNTSLIVLESVNDYITYQIEPPADLREEYDRIMKQRGDNALQTRRLIAGNAETYFNELLNWWHTDHSFTPHKKPDPSPVHTASADTVVTAARYTAPAPGAAAATQDRSLQEVVVAGYATTSEPSLRRASTRGYDKSVRSVNSATNGYLAPNGDPASDGTPAPGAGAGSFTAALADLKTDYLVQLKASPAADRYTLYLQLRKDHLHTPLFYFNTADFFLASGQKATGLKILSNIAELETESYELEKMLGYKLKELGEAGAACTVFKKVMEWRPFEPQSYRDYGLALEDAGHYQQALDTLCYALTKNYDESMSALYPGIEETLLPEINALIAKEKDKLDISRIPKNLLANMPVDIRVVLNWNRSNTDIDLWVTDPDNEKCYYAHRNTEMGGRISHDFTRGFGPEQFLLKTAVKGPYKVEVNYFGDTQVQLAGETTIMAEVYTNYGTPQQHRSIITLQMQRGAQGGVYVGQFDFK